MRTWHSPHCRTGPPAVVVGHRELHHDRHGGRTRGAAGIFAALGDTPAEALNGAIAMAGPMANDPTVRCSYFDQGNQMA